MASGPCWFCSDFWRFVTVALQTPAGAAIDAVHRKRTLLAVCLGVLVAAAFLLMRNLSAESVYSAKFPHRWCRNSSRAHRYRHDTRDVGPALTSQFGKSGIQLSCTALLVASAVVIRVWICEIAEAHAETAMRVRGQRARVFRS